MKQRRQTTHAIDFLFTITLLAFFAISALLAVVIGARVYERITENMSINYDSRTSIAYVTEKIRQHDAAGGVLRAGQQRDGPPVFEPAFEHEKGSKAVLGRFTRRALGPRLTLRALGAAANTAAATVLPPHELGPAVRIEFIHIVFTPLLKNFCPSICARRGGRSPPLPRPDGTFHKERAPLWCFAVQFDKVIKFLSDFAQNNIDILF